MRSKLVAPYAPVVIKLLQGPVYHDEAVWNILLQYAEQVKLYCAQLGLELQMHEEDGFAYLRQPELEDDEGHPVELPRLTRRIPLTYNVSLLCVLLREQLLQFETNSLESITCILTKEQLYELLLPILPEQTNELLVRNKADALIEQVISLGFLKRRPNLGPEYFEVRRILKAKISVDQLVELKERLKGYATN